MNAKTLLLAAKKLIVAGWCQGDWATGPLGGSVKPLSMRARHYCIVGALARAAGKTGEDFMADSNLRAAMGLLRRAEPFTPTIPLTDFNDRKHVTKADVLDLFDEALLSA